MPYITGIKNLMVNQYALMIPMKTIGSQRNSKLLPNQFVPNIKMRFEKANNPGIGSNIDMDYSLFEMVHAMSEGYSPTYQERNIHTDFVGSIRKLIELGTKTKEILIIPTSEEKKEKYIFENNEFGFEFRRLQQ